MKKWTLLFVVGLLLFVVGLFVGRASRKVKQEVKITMDAAVIAAWGNLSEISQVLEDYEKPVYEPIPMGKDTFWLTDTVRMGDVPWRALMKSGVATTIVNKKYPMDIPWDLYVLYKGTIDTLHVGLHEASTTIEVKVKKPVVDFYSLASAWVNLDLLIVGELEVGVSFWDRVSVFGKVVADHERRANMGAGIKVRIF